MDKAKLIENIKSQLKSLMTNEVKFAEIKAGDLLISTPDEMLVVGSEVFTVDQDGNNIPLNDGEYTLDSGEIITVAAGKIEGIIASNPVEAVEDVPEEEVVVEDEPNEEAPGDPEEDVSTEEEDMSAVKMKELETRVAKCEAMLEEMTKMNNKMEQELSKVGALPSTSSISVEPSEFKSVEDKKSNFGSVDIMSIREKARRSR
jgi:hypothetical protein